MSGMAMTKPSDLDFFSFLLTTWGTKVRTTTCQK